MKRITISASRTYDVIIGRDLLQDAGRYVSEVLPLCTICVVTDSTVDGLYADAVTGALAAAGYGVCKFVFPAGEASKNIAALNEILEYLAQNRLTRSDAVVALGGGVTGDMAGFAAATYLRGIQFIQLPTTLLAAVDSSVGGKTGVNAESGKNLIGAFWQPSLVLCDCAAFDTLPREVFLDGIAEAVKYGVIIDKALFCCLSSDDYSLEEVVECCVAIKSSIVEQDERDLGTRQLLNFGHTIGHAIEKCSHYTVSHGHAVAIGMVVAARAAESMGLTLENCSRPIRSLLLKYVFDLGCPYTAEMLTEAALNDKKRSGDTITLILPKAIGNCVPAKLEISLLAEFIASGLKSCTEKGVSYDHDR